MGSLQKLTSRQGELVAILLMDSFSLGLANALYYYLRVHSGLFRVIAVPDFLGPLITLSAFVMLVFWFWGLYRYSRLHSRLDEFASVVKASTVAVTVLFFAIFFDDATNGRIPHFRLLIVIYWSLIVFLAGGARIILRTFQRNLLLSGIGLHNALIVGVGKRAVAVYDMALKYRALGFKPVGFVTPKQTSSDGLPAPIVATVSALESAIKRCDAREVILALEENEREGLLNILTQVNGENVSVKMVPDLHDAISGQVRVGQLYGFPLIEITPQLMQPWEEATKRTVDILVFIGRTCFGSAPVAFDCRGRETRL